MTAPADPRLRSTHEFVNGVCQLCDRAIGSPLARLPCPAARAVGRPGHMIQAGNTILSVSGWARRLGCRDTVIFERLRRGWDPVVAVTTPVKRTVARAQARAKVDPKDLMAIWNDPVDALRCAGFRPVVIDRSPGGWIIRVPYREVPAGRVG